jgi:PAS domain-containing protein
VAVVFDNITNRKLAEKELRKSHDELELGVRKRTAQLAQVNQELRLEMERRKMAAEAIRAERQRLFDVLETLPVYVCLLTPDYHVSFANRVFRECFGESKGRRCFEHLFGRTEPCEDCRTYEVLRASAPRHSEWLGPDGRNYSVFDFPFRDTDGSILILEMGIDITEQKQAETELSATISRLEVLNQELQEFAFVASHDLQEPLRKIQTFCDMAKSR